MFLMCYYIVYLFNHISGQTGVHLEKGVCVFKYSRGFLKL